MASVSAPFKAFMDATSNEVMAKGFAWKDKIAAGFTNSGSRSGDKLASLIQLAHLLHSMACTGSISIFHQATPPPLARKITYTGSVFLWVQPRSQILSRARRSAS
jgi:hypothetical protein